jgi:predicted Zn-dependent protease
VRHPASYTDGRSARRHEVSVQADASALHIYSAEGALLDAWPYAGLYTAEEVTATGPVRLRHRRHAEATLTLASVVPLREVEARAGRRLGGHPWLRPTLVAGLLAVLLLAAGVLAAAWGLPRLAAPLAHWVPPAWEQALGERVVGQIAQGHSFCTRAAGQAALMRLVGRLAAQAELPFALQVHVLPSGTVNAFATPGGHIVVLQGLLRAVASPEELAGVLAHEIAHVAQRHPMQNVIRNAGTALLVQAVTGDASSLDAIAARFGQTLLLNAYSREDELAADRIGVELLNRADIRGDALAAFLRRLSAAQPGAEGAPPWLSTHPATAERIALIEAQARGRGRALSDAQWRALRGMCE